MDVESLKKKLAALQDQRAKLAAAVAQLDGAIGFCKGLIQEAERKPVSEEQSVHNEGG